MGHKDSIFFYFCDSLFFFKRKPEFDGRFQHFKKAFLSRLMTGMCGGKFSFLKLMQYIKRGTIYDKNIVQEFLPKYNLITKNP